jgi:hypothetical protein
MSAAPKTNGWLDPAVLVPCEVGEIFLAGLVVNQADDECPHDPTSLFDRGLRYRMLASGRLRGAGKMVSSQVG